MFRPMEHRFIPRQNLAAPQRTRAAAACLLIGSTLLLSIACRCSPPGPGGGQDGGALGDASEVPVDPLLVERPFELKVPRELPPERPMPLVLLLHGYGANGAAQDLYFGLGKLVDEKGFLLALPDGKRDKQGRGFWSATDACCNMDDEPVDDVAYLKAILKDTKARYRVDEKRVFVVGHSNGGFMAHRMACDVSDQIAAIVSLAGAVWKDPSRCKPDAAVSVLQVHGDADDIIRYGGGRFMPGLAEYPSASDTVALWAQRNRCSGALIDSGMPLDLESGLAGAETRVERYAGCPQAAVERWTLVGGAHIPELQPSWAGTVYGFLMAHPKR